MKKIRYIFILILVSGTNIISQSVFSSQNASASAILIVPLSITATLGDLDFGEIILTGVPTIQRKTPQDGKLFVVSGHPNRSVTFTFNSVILDNASWVATGIGKVDNLQFVPNIELDGGTKVRSGDSHPLRFVKGIGRLNVWVGGAIKISATQKNGDYTGRFTLNVTY
ncbi:MAG: DUF4402 domain-containing protein [Melioribacteraceae bacterium]|nr:DUF4402 domain-containing protein [Melioribacteraceae bacterium]